MAVQGTFYGIPNSTLQPILANYMSCLIGIATAGQSYAISGRNFTRANLAEVRNTIAELQSAIDRNNGARPTVTYANMNGRSSQSPTSAFVASAPGG